ncbi:MAG: hypothetical protein IT246_09555 [Bacteroidia bacterium]|nr:hypothetical protein [Bacteroidia bacterium]
MRSKIVLFFGLLSNLVLAQQHVQVQLNDLARDDRFERFNLNLALFEVKNDTILSWDFEGLRKAVPYKIIKPGGYNFYAYGYLFFAANTQGTSPGFITVLVANPFHKTPMLYADLNNNNDFTDDGEALALPWRGDTTQIKLCVAGTSRCTDVKLTHNTIEGKFEYKRLMNEYYAFTYPDRKFIGMEHCYREQHYQAKSGVLNLGNDSIRVVLFDANNNGIYNEPDSDKFVLANYSDTLVYPFDELYSSVISKKQGACFIDKNGRMFEYISALPDGSAIDITISDRTTSADAIKPGKKLPLFKYITHKGEKKRICRLDRYKLYLYFGNPQSSGFSEDTASLRVLQTEFSKTLRVISFIEVQKSYELSIIGQYGHVNWILAYKDKNLNKKLGVRGIPSSIFTKKRRKVIQYNLTPTEVLQLLRETK